MPKNDPQKSISFSADELKEVVDITQTHSRLNKRIILISREKCDAIFLFIEKVLKSIRRHRIRKFIIYGAENIALIKSGNELIFEISFKQKEMKKSVFDKLHNNTKMHMEIKNKKEGGSVLLIMPEKGGRK